MGFAILQYWLQIFLIMCLIAVIDSYLKTGVTIKAMKSLFKGNL
jgi:hypothetical protein